MTRNTTTSSTTTKTAAAANTATTTLTITTTKEDLQSYVFCKSSSIAGISRHLLKWYYWSEQMVFDHLDYVTSITEVKCSAMF